MPAQNLGWLRSPLWDVAVLGLGWVPFYVWVAIGSAGDAHWGSQAGLSFTAAVAVALAVNFVHRQYVLLLVYGDSEVLAERPRAYAVAPIVAFAFSSAAA